MSNQHTSFNGTDEQRVNLVKLAKYLEALPIGYQDFDMSLYDAAARDPLEATKCGTVACACGHGPRAGISALLGESWAEYSDQAFGVDDDSDAWSWCFGATWQKTDNTPHGAAVRIHYMLANGIPTDAYHQSIGSVPLSYAVPA